MRKALRQDEIEGDQVNRINGWQRIGVVLSALWCLGVVGFATKAYYTYFQNAALEAHNAECRENARKWPSPEDKEEACVKALTWSEAAALEHEGVVGKTPVPPVLPFLALLFLPIAGGWLVVYAAIWATKWVREGLG